jgi:hypothetical protein
MIPLITVIITAIGVGFILNLLFKSSEKDLDERRKEREKKEDAFKGADPKKVFNKRWDDSIPRPRICPACGSALKQNEYLFASMDENVPPGKKKPVHIYGCKYCYLGMTKDSSEIIKDSLDI